MASNKRRKKKISIFKKPCVFCGGLPLIEQHLFPQWINNIYPDPTFNYMQNTMKASFQNGIFDENNSVEKKQGKTSAKRTKNVCRICNGGWISDLEVKAKPLLIDLIDLKNIKICDEQKATLSSWMALMSIMLGYDKHSVQVVKKDERVYLKENLSPSSSWEIWIGRSQSEKYKRSFSCRAISLNSPFEILSGNVEPHAQVAIFGIKNFVFLTKYNAKKGITFAENQILIDNYARIWPLDGSQLDFPRKGSITEEEFNDFIYNKNFEIFKSEKPGTSMHFEDL
ncbi:hypothetical protein [Mucilaginibacter sp. HD30]